MSKTQRALRNRIIVSALDKGMNSKEVARHVRMHPHSITQVYSKVTGHGYRRPILWKNNLKLRNQLKRVRELLTLFPTMTFEPFDEPGWEGFGMYVLE